jgi:bifunctional non-homologous end joining protein LigD
MLDQYAAKREFNLTPEPRPTSRRRTATGALTFVIQKHAATRLHYDFRLEAGGVLKSWAVPKGPSLDPAHKRLAKMVEDHPLGYAHFEGVIPEGRYGAGEVIVWDRGTYTVEHDDRIVEKRTEAEALVLQGIERGKLTVHLRGAKLRGAWTLVRTRQADNKWLLIKKRDETADPSQEVLANVQSVASGRTIEEVRETTRRRNGAQGTLSTRDAERGAGLKDIPGVRAAKLPLDSLEPMLATLTDRPFSDCNWLFEPKLDGMRALAVIAGGKVTLSSRRGQDATRLFPSLLSGLHRYADRQMILDGEIVALDERGAPSFQRIQQRINLSRPSDVARADVEIPVFYYVFDLLYLDGYDLRGVALERRKKILESVLVPQPPVRLVAHFPELGERAYEEALKHGFEGVVAKRRDSLYECRKRSRLWLKLKSTRSDDFVIGGYTQGAGRRTDSFGALLVGQYDDRGQLIYAGHVGTGFDRRTLDQLLARLQPLQTDDCPFAERPPLNAPATWIRPEVVAEIKFMQRTRDGILRAPVFVGLRPDKGPRDAVPAMVIPTPAPEPCIRSHEDDGVKAILAQLTEGSDTAALGVQGHVVNASSLNKVLWPAFEGRRALTKRDLLVYLTRMSPILLSHLRDRPITLTRYPDGIGGGHFYQRHWDKKRPEFVDTVTVFSEHNGRDVEYLLCNNLPTLLWLGQLADIELHTWFSRTDPEPDGHYLSDLYHGSEANIDGSRLNYPDFIAFDLDPYIYSGRERAGQEPELNRQAFARTCEVALRLKAILDSLSLVSYVKTSGRTGLHIFVPVLREYPFEAIRAACETIGRYLVKAYPDDVTMQWSTKKRTGMVFFDHNMNARSKTIASIYSPRAIPEASVSMPIRWEEVGEIYPPDFNLLTAHERMEAVGDLWAGILAEKRDLKSLVETTAAHPYPK